MPRSIRNTLIVGGGIGGLTLGIALARQGVEVDLVELREKVSALGVGIIQNANALRVLRGLGLLEPVHAAGFQMDERRFCDAVGNTVVGANALRTLDPKVPAINNIPRPALHKILTDAALAAGVRLRMNDTVAQAADHGDAVEEIGRAHV